MTKLTQSDLDQFTGTENWYKHPFYGWMLYTDGVKFFADNAANGAYWFLDIIGTEFRALTKKEEFIHIQLIVTEGKPGANIVADDGNDNVIYTRHILSTDCPPGTWRFYLEPGGPGGAHVLLLPGEH